MKNKPYIIAIAGGSASGKSTFASKLYDLLKDDHKVFLIKQDDYYKDQSHLSFEERTKTNYDHPNAFDNELLYNHLNLLKQHISIQKPTYDYVTHNRSTVVETIEDGDVYIIEGLFTLYDEKVRSMCHLLIYIDCQDDIRFIRRLKRDMEERGRSLQSITDQYLNTVKPMHDQYVDKTKSYAHMIINGNGDYLPVLDLIKNNMEML